MKITIVQDRRDRMFHLIRDDEEELLPGHTYTTLAEARIAMNRLTTRVPQSYIDQLLLSDDEDQQCLGRLFASETWPAFEAWLDAEPIRTADDAVRVLDAIISFTTTVLAGVAREHWPVGEPDIDQTIERLVVRRLKKMLAD